MPEPRHKPNKPKYNGLGDSNEATNKYVNVIKLIHNAKNEEPLMIIQKNKIIKRKCRSLRLFVSRVVHDLSSQGQGL